MSTQTKINLTERLAVAQAAAIALLVRAIQTDRLDSLKVSSLVLKVASWVRRVEDWPQVSSELKVRVIFWGDGNPSLEYFVFVTLSPENVGTGVQKWTPLRAEGSSFDVKKGSLRGIFENGSLTLLTTIGELPLFLLMQR